MRALIAVGLGVLLALGAAPFARADDVQLPTCAIGEEVYPDGDGYSCGPADPACEKGDWQCVEPTLPINTFSPTDPGVIIGDPVYPDEMTLADTGVESNNMLGLFAIVLLILGIAVIIWDRNDDDWGGA